MHVPFKPSTAPLFVALKERATIDEVTCTYNRKEKPAEKYK